MSITFSVAPKKDLRDQAAEPKYYAVAKSTGQTDTNAVAKEIARMYDELLGRFIQPRPNSVCYNFHS